MKFNNTFYLPDFHDIKEKFLERCKEVAEKKSTIGYYVIETNFLSTELELAGNPFYAFQKIWGGGCCSKVNFDYAVLLYLQQKELIKVTYVEMYPD